MKSIPLKDIEIEDEFWSKYMSLVENEVLPYQWSALCDEVTGAEKSHVIRNFKLAAKVLKDKRDGKKAPIYPTGRWHYDESECPEGSFLGWVFQDSDLYKWIEASSYSLIHRKDDITLSRINYAIDLIESATEDDGYVDTLYTINNIDNRFESLKDFHELYCFGHLVQGACAHFKATGSRRFLDIACKFADLICDTFGKGKKRGCPGHPLCEMALIELYGVTGNKKYLDESLYFLNERGTEPNVFDKEQNIETDGSGYIYNQAHLPIRQQQKAVGHAVRGVYLYTAGAQAAMITDDTELKAAMEKIFDNISRCKTYCTGGIGARAEGESFGDDFELPDDTAYCETCASIGLVFFADAMAKSQLDSRYGDVAEKAIWNTIPGCVSPEGKSFLYVNAPEVSPKESRQNDDKKHITPTRQKWFGCACCPPNFARFTESIGKYAFSIDDNRLIIEQIIGARLNTPLGKIRIESDYTEHGKITVTVQVKKTFKLYIRIPSWSDNIRCSKKYECDKGYAVFDIKDDCKVEIDFGAEIQILSEDERIDFDKSKVYVKRTAFVYCCQGADNPKIKDINDIEISKTSTAKYDNEVITLDDKIKLIPFYSRMNKGETEIITHIKEK